MRAWQLELYDMRQTNQLKLVLVIYLQERVNFHPVAQQSAISSVFGYARETVCGGAQPPAHFPRAGVRLIRVRLRKHSGLRRHVATSPCVSQQFPERMPSALNYWSKDCKCWKIGKNFKRVTTNFTGLEPRANLRTTILHRTASDLHALSISISTLSLRSSVIQVLKLSHPIQTSHRARNQGNIW